VWGWHPAVPRSCGTVFWRRRRREFNRKILRGKPTRCREEEEEEEEGLYLRIETRKRVQTNEAKSKRRRASPTQTTSQRDNTPASRCLPSRRVLLARKGNRQPITPQGLQGWRAHPKKWPCQGHQPQQWCERTRHPCWRGMEHAWDPQGCAARPAKKIEGVEPHPIIPCVYYDELPRLDALTPKGRVIGGGGARTPRGRADLETR